MTTSRDEQRIDRRAFLAATATTAGLLALPGAAAADDDDGDETGYTMAEWGVFVLAGDLPSGRAADLETDYPAFASVVRRDRTGFMKAVQEALDTPIVVTKPVVTFRSASKTTIPVRVEVGFPEGRPLVWYPNAAWGAASLAWDMKILLARAEVEMTEVPEGHWWHRLRRTGANPVQADGEYEGFLYYDGETALRNRVEVVGNRVLNGYEHAIHDVLIVHNDRESGAPRVRRCVGRIEAGAAVDLGDEVVETGEIVAGLRGSLVDAGLPAPDADSFVDVWKDELLEARGLSIAFRLPEAVYDRLLPISLTPAPTRRARVGYGLAIDLDPDMAAVLARLIDRLGDESWDLREEARRDLSRLGQRAVGALRVAEAGHEDAHVRREAGRLREVIEARYSGDEIPERFREHFDDWRRDGKVNPYKLHGGFGRR